MERPLAVSDWEPVQLEQFVEAEYAHVVRTVALVCGDVSFAEDAVQNALAAALDTTRRGGRIDDLAAWVVVVAINSSRRRLRRAELERSALYLLAQLQREEAPAFDGRFADLRIGLLALPLRQRQAVVLYYLHDLDVPAVARALGVSVGTIKTALFRARQSLARALEPDPQLMEEHHDR